MATTTEGTGNGSVERSITRASFKNNLIKVENIIGLKKIIEEKMIMPPIDKIDGGEISAMMMKLSREDMITILEAAEILKKLK